MYMCIYNVYIYIYIYNMLIISEYLTSISNNISCLCCLALCVCVVKRNSSNIKRMINVDNMLDTYSNELTGAICATYYYIIIVL